MVYSPRTRKPEPPELEILCATRPADFLMDQREDPGNADTRLNAVSTKLGAENIVKETWTRPGRGIAQSHLENLFGTLADQIRTQVCN